MSNIEVTGTEMMLSYYWYCCDVFVVLVRTCMMFRGPEKFVRFPIYLCDVRLDGHGRSRRSIQVFVAGGVHGHEGSPVCC